MASSTPARARAKRTPTYLEKIVSRARQPSAMVLRSCSPPKNGRSPPRTPTAWEREMSPGRVPPYQQGSAKSVGVAARVASPSRELEEVTRTVMLDFEQQLEDADDEPPSRAARIAANFGDQLMGADTEKNVQRTRINKLKQRIAELERKMVRVRESAPISASAATGLPSSSKRPRFADPPAGPGKSGPVWELADMLMRGGRRDPPASETRAEGSADEGDGIGVYKMETELSKALKKLDNDGWEHTLESFTEVVRRLFADSGVGVYDGSAGGNEDQKECERRLKSFCSGVFVQLINMQRERADKEGSYSGGDVERVNVVELRPMLEAELERLDVVHVMEYLRADLDAAGFVAKALVGGGIISPDVLVISSEDEVIASLDGVEGDLRRLLCQRLTDYQRALSSSAHATVVDQGDAPAASLSESVPRACLKFAVNGEGPGCGVGYANGLAARHGAGLSLTLESYIGLPAVGGGVFEDMEWEHKSDVEFYDASHGIRTTPLREWEFVRSEETGQDCGGKTAAPHAGKRMSLPLRVLMKTPQVIDARLSHEEVTALRLFTGPMHHVYNEMLQKVHSARRSYRETLSTLLNSPVLSEVLAHSNADAIRFEEQQALLQRVGIDQMGTDQEAEAKYVSALREELGHQSTQRLMWLQQLKASAELGEPGQAHYQVLEALVGTEALIRAQLGENEFVTTVHVVTSALAKLSALPPTNVLEAEGKAIIAWRALSGHRLPAGLEVGAYGERMAVELGFTSASLDPARALAATGSSIHSGFPLPVLFEIELGWHLDRGVQLEWVAQFPAEREIAFPALCCLELCGPPRLCKIVTSEGGKWAHVYRMRVRAPVQKTCLFDPDGRVKMLRQAYDTSLLLEISRDLQLELKTVEDNPDATPQLIALAGSLMDAICKGAREVLADPTAQVDRSELSGMALKAFEAGRSSGFTVPASEIVFQHGLSAQAAAAEATRMTEQQVAQAQQSLCVQMMEAAEEGQASKCQALIEEGCDVNYSTKRGVTALHKARNVPTAQCLLEGKANVSAQDKSGLTPFSWALKKRNIELMTLLLKHGAEATRDILAATESANVQALKMLLNAGPGCANVCNERMETPLYLSIGLSNLEIVQELLEAGADPDGQFSSLPDESPTTKASGEKTAAPGREDISSIATGSQDMATGEDAQAAAISPDGTEAITQDESTENGEPMSRPATDSGPEERRTPLARAVEMANLDIVRLLLDRDADMMLRTSLSRQTALHIAVDLELLDIVDVLLAAAEERKLLKTENEDFFAAQDKLGNTVLHTCVITGNLEILKRLIKSCKGGGDTVNMCNQDGKTALFLACQGASGGAAGSMEELAMAVVQHGADKASSRDEFPEFNFLDGDNIVVAGDPDKPAAAPTEAAPPAAAPSGDLPLDSMDSSEHAKAALKIQNRARVKNAQKDTARLKAEGNLPGQLRAKKIEQWGTAIFKKFDADADGKLTAKELASALQVLPKTKPKKAPPGAKFQSVEEMMNTMDSDESGSLDLAEWLANLGQCPGLAAALAENVAVGEDNEEVSVAVEEVAAMGNMIAAGELEMPSGEDAEKAAVKIQSIARGKRDRARVDGIKGAAGDGAVSGEGDVGAGGGDAETALTGEGGGGGGGNVDAGQDGAEAAVTGEGEIDEKGAADPAGFDGGEAQ